MASGKVLRRHAGGYLVYSSELNVVFQCPLRARLKKQGISVVTGDLVELEELEPPASPQDRGSAVISARLERRNLLRRPFLANLDQVFIVQSIHQPDWNPLLCDRYLVQLQLELDGIKCFICVNKCDLASQDEITALRNIYEPLGYATLFVSARAGIGIENLKEHLGDYISAFIGPSGVGKSSLINRLIPDLNLKVDINEELLYGRHTTTYSELYEIPKSNSEEKSCWLADTPGFSIGELEYPQPADVAWQFPEIVPLAPDCKFSNCLHLVESDCNVLKNISKIAESRYASYTVIVADAQNAATIHNETSQKVDAGSAKQMSSKAGGLVVPRLNERFRISSKRKERQNLIQYRNADSKNIPGEEDDDNNNDETVDNSDDES